MKCMVLLLLAAATLISENDGTSCHSDDLKTKTEFQHVKTSTRQELAKQTFQHGSIYNGICKTSGKPYFAFCNQGTWISDEKQCLQESNPAGVSINRGQKRKKRFLFSWIFVGFVSLFTRFAKPKPRDRTPPEIRNCPGDIFEEAIPFQYYAFVRWTEPLAWDNIQGEISVSRSGLPPGAPFFEGETGIGYYARDSSGNQASCRFTIHIHVVRCPTLSPKIPDGYRVCHLSYDMVKGTTCNYGCYQGHDLKGGPSKSECLPTGNWSISSEPYCEKRECPVITTISPLNFSCSSLFYFRSICSYDCSDGYDIPTHMRRSKVCLASGQWNGDDAICVDVEPPTFDQCPETLMFYPDDNEDEATIYWDKPTASDNKDYVIIPRQLSGPPRSTRQKVNSYTITYEAADEEGNKAKYCSFTVVVKQLRCPKLYPMPYMNLNCTGTRRGSQCSFSCDDNAVLNGTNTVFCQRPDNMPYSKWDMTEQPFCQVLDLCPELSPPKHGALACDIWLGGRFCHPLCSEGYSVLVTQPLPNLLLCLDDGTWLNDNQLSDCKVRATSRRRLAEMAAEFYFNGDCRNPDVQIMIKEQFLTALTKSPSWSSQCKSSVCNIRNVEVSCGDISRKRSLSTMKIKINLNIDTSADQTLSSENYEKEVVLLSDLTDSIRVLSQNLTVVINDSDTLTFIGILSSGLEVECAENSVPVFDLYVGCVPCPAGTFYNNLTKACVTCPRGYYQSEDAKIACLACPKTQTTARLGAVRSDECEDACLPGTWSSNGLPPCIECDIGYYEGSYGSIHCSKCPGNQITLIEGIKYISECYDFDIVFPRETEASFSELDFDSIALKAPFYVSFYVICKSGVNGTLFNLSSSEDSLLITTSAISITGTTEDLPESCSARGKWLHFLIHLSEIKAEVFIDNENVLTLTTNNVWFKDDVVVTIGGDGFAGSISQLNIFSASQYISNDISNICDSRNHTSGVVNWSDFVFSSLINSYINLPSQCDDIDGCRPTPCFNGTCHDILDGYLCICSKGFTGIDCEINIDDCTAHACQNNATCVDIVSGYECDCEYGYTGILCEIAMVDGQWSEWDNWTECSVSCGNGTRKRMRSCSDPQPENGGKYCIGFDNEVENCDLDPCRECSELLAANHSSLLCTNTSDMIVCTQTCDDGYMFDHDTKDNYICGNETFYYWDFQTEENPYGRLPYCTKVVDPLKIFVDFTAFYDFEACSSFEKDAIESIILTEIVSKFNELSCKLAGSCSFETFEVLGCDEKRRKRRDVENKYVGFTLTMSCDSSIVGTENCYFSLGDTVDEIEKLRNNDTLDLPYNSSTYVVQSNSTDCRLDCPVGHVPFILFCVPCSIGHYYSNGECLPCDYGTYQLLTGQTSCFICPTGTSTEGLNSISIDDCNVNVAVNNEDNPMNIIGIAIGVPVTITVVLVSIAYCRNRQVKRIRRLKKDVKPIHANRTGNAKFNTIKIQVAVAKEEHIIQ